MDYISLGRRIHQKRRELRMTQTQLAAKVGLSVSFLGHIERGSRKASLESIVSLCNALNVSPNYLLEQSLTITLPGQNTPERFSPSDRRRMREMVFEFSRWLDVSPEDEEPVPADPAYSASESSEPY